MKVFIVLCLGVAFVAGAAIEKEAEAAPEQSAKGDKKPAKRGLFDLGYGYGSGYGDHLGLGHAGLYGGLGYDSFGYGGLDLGVSKTVVKHHHHTVPVVVERKVPIAVPVVQKVVQKVAVPTIIEKHVPYPVSSGYHGGYHGGLSGYGYGISHHGYSHGLGHGYGFDNYHHHY